MATKKKVFSEHNQISEYTEYESVSLWIYGLTFSFYEQNFLVNFRNKLRNHFSIMIGKTLFVENNQELWNFSLWCPIFFRIFQMNLPFLLVSIAATKLQKKCRMYLSCQIEYANTVVPTFKYFMWDDTTFLSRHHL